MALPVDRSLALGTLRTLARHQRRTTDPVTEEGPGRILHAVRPGVDSGLSLGGGSIYYGTVDASPLFVVLLGDFAGRGRGERHTVEDLLPHADRALMWMERHGDRDGDGFLEYRRADRPRAAESGLEGLLGRDYLRRRPAGRSADCTL